MVIATELSGKVEFTRNNLTEEKTMAEDSMAFTQWIRPQGGEDGLT
jgi:hypothetical protein